LKKILAVALMVAMLGVGALAAETIKIGVSIPTADHGWTGGINYWAQVAIDDWKAQDADIEFFLVTAANPAEHLAD
jgi:ribose transport system substrate-binding protein